MTDPTYPVGTAPAGSPTAVTAMRREVADLHQQVADLRSLQASGRLWVWGSTALIILMFALFMYTTYHRIRGNFDQQAMQKAISEHGAEMLPMTQTMLGQAGQDVLPAYRDAVAATLRARGPAVAKAAVKRLQDVPAQSGKEFQDKVRATFDAAVAKIEPEFKTAYPNLTDDKRQQVIQAFVSDEITAQNKRIASRVDQLYTDDLTHMQGVLDKFDMPTPAGPDGQQVLERQFLHTMVALLDNQVDVALPATAAVPSVMPMGAPNLHTRVTPLESSTRPTTAP